MNSNEQLIKAGYLTIFIVTFRLHLVSRLPPPRAHCLQHDGGHERGVRQQGAVSPPRGEGQPRAQVHVRGGLHQDPRRLQDSALQF